MGRRPTLPPLSSQVSESRYCFLSTSTSFTRGLRLLMAGREVCRKDYEIRREGYPSLALELVVAGAGTVAMGGRTRSLIPGMIFSYGPGTLHAIQAGKGAKLVKYFVDFVGEEAVQMLKLSGLTPGRVAMVRNPESLITVFELILSRSGKSSSINSDLCCDYLRALLRMIAETTPVRFHPLKPDDCCSRAIEMIDAEYASIKSISEVAGRLGVTPEHLSRSFREMREDPPSKRLTLKKLNRAVELLLSGGWKVKEVAYELGYATQFHFSSVFKRHFGHSPRTLQQRMRGGVITPAHRRHRLLSSSSS